MVCGSVHVHSNNEQPNTHGRMYADAIKISHDQFASNFDFIRPTSSTKWIQWKRKNIVEAFQSRFWLWIFYKRCVRWLSSFDLYNFGARVWSYSAVTETN